MEAGDGPMAAIDRQPQAGVGETLRARRIELGLSPSDVAAMVKLPARRIEAMEQERWSELPDGPYLRGFLRNVARALNLDPADLVARVEGSLVRPPVTEPLLVPPGSTHVTLPRRSGPADDRRGGRPLVFGAFGFAVIAALIAWSGTDSFDRALVAGRSLMASAGGTKPASGDAATGPIDPAPQGGATAPATTVPGDAVPASEPATATSATSALNAANATASPGPGTSALSLLFHFNEESWVEVYSADGKALLKRLNAPGSEQAVQGEAPYTLVVGNAKGVSLQFRGQPVDLTPYTHDSVARFKLS